MRRLLPLFALVVACGGSQKSDDNTTVTVEPYDGPETTEPSIEDSRGKVARIGALFAALGDSVDAAGTDCDKMAANITDWTATHRDEVAKLNTELSAMPKAHVDELAPTLEKTLQRAALQIKDGSDRCPDHEGLFRAKSGLRL